MGKFKTIHTPRRASRGRENFTPQPAAMAAHEGNHHETGCTEKSPQKGAAKETRGDEAIRRGKESQGGRRVRAKNLTQSELHRFLALLLCIDSSSAGELRERSKRRVRRGQALVRRSNDFRLARLGLGLGQAFFFAPEFAKKAA